MQFSTLSCLAAFLLPSLAVAQLSGTVGPSTTRASKQATVCNVLDYGGVASKTSDVGPAIASAFAACKSGGTVYIPAGDYGMSTWVTLSGGTAWALQLDGIIYRTGTAGGNMFMIEHTTDFEMYSSTSTGAIQGYGYEFHKSGTYGPRILRLYEATSFSVHDIALVDSPAFHFSLDTCDSGEIYNMIIRGGNEGGLDGIDVWSTNIWIHDIEVTNKDECVTVKSPASNILIENIYCNWSGGCAMGSLGASVAVSNVIYSNVYTSESNQMMMIKSNGGSGSVKDCQFNNFIGKSNAYSLDIDSYWSSMTAVTGSGIELSGLSFDNWTGTCSNGASRGPLKVICPAGVPCTNITISNFNMWTEAGSELVNKYEAAYGTGGGLNTGSSYTSYIATSTVTAAPSGYSAATMASDLTAGLGISVSIAIPTIPTSFFPGATPYSALLGKSAGTAKAAVAASSSTATASATSSAAKVAATSSAKSTTSASSTSTKSSAAKSAIKSAATKSAIKPAATKLAVTTPSAITESSSSSTIASVATAAAAVSTAADDACDA
ncbi:glycoside hydrolase family 28 protein [Coleophoma crateriformis]|uniref:Glycoside hydrolase family 28 protein n=1 Tax=Coleophoma crateriformis TaxID=565419 RepID=A0A3D8SGL4_9HELO|nr:glycoside hydrolase family 28 protein [Coleophoma crateriformis]